MVCEITNKHYEVGNRAKCYKEVWRRYVNPIYPMCYRTYLSYINASMRVINEAVAKKTMDNSDNFHKKKKQ